MTTCITATDTFGADGTTVLMERGTKLVGETRGEVQQGSARVFVLWTEARTPTGVVIPLASSGTDELGRAGLSGDVNRHFWQRFGAAILISLISGGEQYAVQSQSKGGTVIYDPSATEGVMTDSLKSTVDIPPTVTVANGSRIQVLVARDLDFRSVYELRPSASR
jgi:type IV secretion system protein VirB10